MQIRPPFPYVGSKAAIAGRVAAEFPAHRHYVEVCAGSLAVLLAKPPSSAETVNDLNGDLVAFWRTLRDHPHELARACALTPHSRVEMYGALEPSDDEIEQARRVWVRLTQNSLRTTEARHDFWVKRITSGVCYPDRLQSWASRLAPAAQRLARVSIDQRPAVEMVEMYDAETTLMYVDPPYPGHDGRYPTRLDDHAELVDALLKARAAVVVSGYPDTIYSRLADAGWRTVEIASRAQVPMGRTVPRTEMLWINRRSEGGRLC